MNNETNNLITGHNVIEAEKLISSSDCIKENNISGSTDPSNKKALHEVRPWIRYIARMIDIYTFLFIGGIFWEILSPTSFPESDFAFGLIVLFLWIFFESICLSILGSTFGKWLLKIKLRTNDNLKLTFLIAFQRSFMVWFKGLAIGIPFISLFTLISAHSDLTTQGITSWDKKYGLKVSYEKIGCIRAIITILLFGLFFSIIIGSKV